MTGEAKSDSGPLHQDWKHKVMYALIFGIVFAATYTCMTLAWDHLRFAIFLALCASVILKVGLLIPISSTVIREATSCGGCLGVAVVIPAILVVLFIFDNQTLPLLANQLGQSTTARITGLFIRAKGARFIRFEYDRDDITFTAEQQVSEQIFDPLNYGDRIAVKYIPLIPQVAAVDNDGGYMKFPLAMSIAIAVTVPLALYGNEITGWWKANRSDQK